MSFLVKGEMTVLVRVPDRGPSRSHLWTTYLLLYFFLPSCDCPEATPCVRCSFTCREVVVGLSLRTQMVVRGRRNRVIGVIGGQVLEVHDVLVLQEIFSVVYGEKCGWVVIVWRVVFTRCVRFIDLLKTVGGVEVVTLKTSETSKGSCFPSFRPIRTLISHLYTLTVSS